MTGKLGLALGSGAARGWSHIGVVRALVERGIRPQVITGCSIGSLVGAAYASDQLDVLEDWVTGLTRMDVFGLLDARFRGGVFQGSRVMNAIGEQLKDRPIEQLDASFAAVATDLITGREIWLREGNMLAAVRASCGLPGLFSPTRHEGRWLIDGGLVNPVPVSLCYAMGAETVIAVNLNAHLANRRHLIENKLIEIDKSDRELRGFEKLADVFSSLFSSRDSEPGILDVVNASVSIMQERITRSRMAGEPPLVEIAPRVDDVQLMDFHRADETIAAGRAAVEEVSRKLEPLARQAAR
ncbi:MAG: patatin-like phospholipase RssA [Gammaproteobacteria bacterium]|nr:patatin-like phospholipase RssA [Gammaproteobacteria bacterium]NNF60466.1 patatin-like phospholipase RssA [Gammaproteobacteria bacterium]